MMMVISRIVYLVKSKSTPKQISWLVFMVQVVSIFIVLVRIYELSNLCILGMTNVVFMPRNSLVIEIVGKFDGRMLPVCGYHGPLIAMYGNHHYLHYYDWKGGELLLANVMAKESYQFYKYIQRSK
jgi:hypothetical protein